MRDILGPRFLIQRGCTYEKVEYRTAVLPGCPMDANPTFTYPVALSCHCSSCRTDSDECAHRASGQGARCTKPVRLVYPHPGNYMIPFWSYCPCLSRYGFTKFIATKCNVVCHSSTCSSWRVSQSEIYPPAELMCVTSWLIMFTLKGMLWT